MLYIVFFRHYSVVLLFSTLSQTIPGFNVSALQVFRKDCAKIQLRFLIVYTNLCHFGQI